MVLFCIIAQACGEFLDLAQRQEKNFQKMLDHERAQRIRLEQTVEDLAKQHNFLEEACRERVVPKHKATEKSQRPPSMTVGSPSIEKTNESVLESSDEEETEFFDAIAEEPDDLLEGLQFKDTQSTPSISSEVRLNAEGKEKIMSHKRSASDYGASSPDTLEPAALSRHSVSAGDLATISSSISSPSGILGEIKVRLYSILSYFIYFIYLISADIVAHKRYRSKGLFTRAIFVAIFSPSDACD